MKKLTFLFDSNPRTGATNVNSLGSRFQVNFDTPLKIPQNATNISVVTKQVTIWFVTPNITFKNNHFDLIYKGDRIAISLPVGLYNPHTLSLKIQQEIQLEANKLMIEVPFDIIELLTDSAESKIIMKFNHYETDVDFTVTNSIAGLLGFDNKYITGYINNVPPSGGPIPFYEKGDNVASFNVTDYFLLKCSSLISKGLYINGKYSGVIAKIDIDAQVNNKINYNPNQTPSIPANELAGIDLSNITFELTNQNNELVDMRGEHWSIIFEIQYTVKPT